MVDNRSAGFFGIGGAFNFKSGDISGTAARTQDDKMGQGGEYFAQEMKEEQEQFPQQTYQDRSAQLRASLNGLAAANAGSMMLMKAIKEKEEKKKKSKTLHQNEEEEEVLKD